MNILKREYRANLKAFIFWIFGLFILIFLGMTKFTGIQAAKGTESMNDLLQQFPKVILAVFGMVEVDVTTLAGYYSIIGYYVMICGAIYAIHLGSNAVSREVIDKTYEFIFTKPRSRNYVLCMKLTAAWINLILFAVFNLVFSYLSIRALGFDKNINQLIFLYTIAVFLISSVFFGLSSLLSVLSKNPERATLYANLVFLVVFILGIIYDTVEDGKIIKFVSPLKYFEAKDLINHQLDIVFIMICLNLTLITIFSTFIEFKGKDLKI